MPTYAFSPETFDGPYSTIPITEVFRAQVSHRMKRVTSCTGAFYIARSAALPTDSMSRPTPFTVLHAASVTVAAAINKSIVFFIVSSSGVSASI